MTVAGVPLESNLLALSPGVVLSYERSAYINASLHRAGVEVVTVTGVELARGRGGCHRLACAIWRDPAD
ncbi:MAG TPA: arginine deiminase family protein [Vicinamibacterales bacterium]